MSRVGVIFSGKEEYSVMEESKVCESSFILVKASKIMEISRKLGRN